MWRTLLGDYPATRALRQGRVASSLVPLDFADVAVPNKAFKRVVRDLEFDVAELALMTFLMARSRGVPIRMLPVVLFSRNPLNYLVCHAGTRLDPHKLEGRALGARAYTTTTAVWTRALLADAFGVDLERLRWLTYEEGHVAGVREPANVHRDAAHADLPAMLLDGAIGAAIVDPVPQNPGIVTVVPDPDGAWRDWRRKTGAQTLNHVVVVRDSLADDRVRMTELVRLFEKSREQSGQPADDSFFTGMEAIRGSLEAGIAAAEAQHLLARPLTADDLVVLG